MAFTHYGTLNPNGGQFIIGGDSGIHKTVLNNSAVATIGGAVSTDSNGDIIANTAGLPVLGIVTDILKNGTSIRTSGSLVAYTAAADNETVDKVYVMVDISKDTLWSCSQNGTAGGTANSNQRGAFIDGASALTLDETTATRTRATSGQYVTWSADQADSTRLVVSINESEMESAI